MLVGDTTAGVAACLLFAVIIVAGWTPRARAWWRWRRAVAATDRHVDALGAGADPTEPLDRQLTAWRDGARDGELDAVDVDAVARAAAEALGWPPPPDRPDPPER